MEDLESKEKQKVASKQYREKQKEIQTQQQEALGQLSIENQRLLAENNLLKEQTNTIFKDLHTTVQELALTLSRLNDNDQIEQLPIQLDQQIFTEEPFAFNQNSFFVFVLFILLILPQVFLPQQFQYNKSKAEFMDISQINPQKLQQNNFAGVYLQTFDQINEKNQVDEVGLREVNKFFELKNLCTDYCEGNLDTQ